MGYLHYVPHCIMNIYRFRPFALILFIFCGSSICKAQIIVDTFPGDIVSNPGYNLPFHHFDGGPSYAALFTNNTGGDVTPGRVSFALQTAADATTPLNLDIYLRIYDAAGDSGPPDARTIATPALWNQNFTAVMDDSLETIFKVDMVGSPILTDGASYWFEIFSQSVFEGYTDGEFNWLYGGDDQTGRVAEIDNPSMSPPFYSYSNDQMLPAYRLEVVPEPSTYALIFGSVALGIVAVWKRKKIYCSKVAR